MLGEWPRLRALLHRIEGRSSLAHLSVGAYLRRKSIHDTIGDMAASLAGFARKYAIGKTPNRPLSYLWRHYSTVI
jgi:hypothetical protein